MYVCVWVNESPPPPKIQGDAGCIAPMDLFFPFFLSCLGGGCPRLKTHEVQIQRQGDELVQNSLCDDYQTLVLYVEMEVSESPQRNQLVNQLKKTQLENDVKNQFLDQFGRGPFPRDWEDHLENHFVFFFTPKLCFLKCGSV